MCSKNGGLFIKVGQHVGALQYLLPREYVQTFKVFHSEAPSTPLPRMKQVIKEEFGRSGNGSDLVLVWYSQVDNLWVCETLSLWWVTSLTPSWWDLLRIGWRAIGCRFSCTVSPWGSQRGWKGCCSEDTTSWRREECLHGHGHNGREWEGLTP